MNVYTDLNELPAWNWFQVIKNNDLKYLLIDRNKPTKEDLQQLFKILNSQLIDELGISDDYRNYLHKLRAFNIAKSEWLLTQSNYDFSMMKVAEMELMSVKSNNVTTSNGYSDKITAERVLGFRIDLKEVSVIEYYNYLKEADKIARIMSKKN